MAVSTRSTRIERVPSAELRLAEDNAALLHAMGIVAVHLIASPGAGKTSLIARTASKLSSRLRPGVIQASLTPEVGSNPLSDLDCPIVQVDTGGRPYLDATMVREALAQLPLADVDLLLIEEVGTLTSPVGCLLGENLRVVVASLPEGDDAAMRYPDPFAHAHAVILNKMDLLSHLRFDRNLFQKAVHRVNPGVPIFEVSCLSGEGLDAWGVWLLNQLEKV